MKPPGRSRKPEAMFCSTCAKREWLKLFGRIPTTAEERSIELNLRDWLGASRIQSAPCLSVCPEAGLSVARRGKTQVLSEDDLKVVNRQFDPTRQLTLFSDTVNEDESTGEAGATS